MIRNTTQLNRRIIALCIAIVSLYLPSGDAFSGHRSFFTHECNASVDPCEKEKQMLDAAQQKLYNLDKNKPKKQQNESDEQFAKRMKDFEDLRKKFLADIAFLQKQLNDCLKKKTSSTTTKKSTVISEPKETKKPETVSEPPTMKIVTSEPCKEGAERGESKEEKHFEYTDASTKISFVISDPNERTFKNAGEFADYLRRALKVQGVGGSSKIYYEPVTGVTGMMKQTVKMGADVLEALSKWRAIPLRDFQVCYQIKPTVIVDAVCVSKEVCEKGKWVPKKKYSEKVSKGEINDCENIDRIDIVKGADRVDWKKVRDKAVDIVNAKMNELQSAKDKYAVFKDACK